MLRSLVGRVRKAAVIRLLEDGTARERWARLDAACGPRLRTAGRILLLADRVPRGLGRYLGARYPGAEVVVLSRAASDGSAGRLRIVQVADDDEMTREAAMGPAPDLVVDMRRVGLAERRAALDALFLALADGGAYVTFVRWGDATTESKATAFERYIAHLASAQSWPPPRRKRGLSGIERVQSLAIGERLERDGVLVVGKSGSHLLRLEEDLAYAAIDARGGRRREIASVAGGPMPMRASFWSNDAQTSADRLKTGQRTIPTLRCMVYEDVVCSRRQVSAAQGVLLPTSYHKPFRRQMTQAGVQDAGPRYARARGHEDAERLPGTYFHLDNEYAGHYGHVITQDLAKLWAWDDALREYPDLRVLIGSARRSNHVPSHTYELLEAFGIERSRVVQFHDPVRVERLVTATQAFQQPAFASPAAQAVWERVAKSLVAQASDAPVPDRVFISRRPSLRRSCLNGDVVEQRFRDAGFDVVYPEDLTLPDQARLFSEASVVAGFGGTGMLNLVYSSRPATRIVIASRTYQGANEYYLAMLQGGDLYYFWCDPVAPDTPTRRNFHWDFRFDADRDGPALDKILASL